MYADDIQIYSPININNITQTFAQLQNDVNNIEKWSKKMDSD